jgi:methenyltetrahydrofolate cyclohydrolase
MASEILISTFLRDLASPDEAHGAVSASAVAGAMGTSLLLMVAGLPKTKSDTASDRTALIAAAAALTEVAEHLIEAVETETAVKIFAARRMPQGSERERAERAAAIQLALRAAADVPLEVMRLCALALKQAKTVAQRGCHAASADVQLAVTLLEAAVNGARSSLEGKLSSLTDVVYTKAVVEDMARVSEQAMESVRAAESFLQSPPV